MNYDKIFGVGNKPTEEQLIIRDAYLRGEDICVEARAGASKSSTSVFITSSLPEKKVLYTAFNKSVIEDGKNSFPVHVDVRTNHSIAYREVGYEYRDKLSRPRGAYQNVAGTVSEIAKYFKVMSYPSCNSFRIAGWALRTVQRFESSADRVISDIHIPRAEVDELVKKYKDTEYAISSGLLKRTILKTAKSLWRARIDKSKPVLCTHDTYLKLFQLNKCKIEGVDVIVLDECQDATECVIDIILNQTHLQKVLIGDSHQAIYQWRGCVNMFEKEALSSYTKLELSKSFRFSQNVADLASQVLRGKVDITGFDKMNTVIGSRPEGVPYTVIYRTNGSLVMDALDKIAEGYKVKIETNVRDLVNKLISIKALQAGAKPKHADIVVFDNFEEFIDEAENNLEFGRLLNIIKRGQAQDIIDALGDYTVPKDPDIIMVTAHKAKGMTIPHVELGDDFPDLYDEHNHWIGNEPEINLLYVALTRPSQSIVLNRQIEFMRMMDNLKKNNDKGIPCDVSLSYNKECVPFLGHIAEHAQDAVNMAIDYSLEIDSASIGCLQEGVESGVVGYNGSTSYDKLAQPRGVEKAFKEAITREAGLCDAVAILDDDFH